MSTAGSLSRVAALLVGIVLAVRPAPTQASQLPLPAWLYPAHTHIQSRHQDVLAMTCWTGSIEAEGIVFYKHGSPTQRHLAMMKLASQIRAAVSQLTTQ